MGTVKYSGPVASFHCPTEATIRSLKVHFSPKQEGSGTPSPENVRAIEGWDGVCSSISGTNIANTSVFMLNKSISWGGVKGTYGNFTTTNYHASFLFHIPQGVTLTLTCHNSDIYWVDRIIPVKYDSVDWNSNFLGYYNYALYGNVTQRLTTRTWTMPEEADGLLVRFRMVEDIAITQELFNNLKMSCVIGSVAPEIYEPYHGTTTNYEFGVLGKNKLNIGTVSFTGYKKYEIEGGLMPATYTASALITSDDEDSTKSLMLFQNENGTIKQIFLERNIRNAVTFTLTQPATSVYIYSGDSYQRSVGDATTWSEVQLELGSTATAYEPYDPNKTVYGGWVDLVSGEVQEDGIDGYPYCSIILKGTEEWTLVKQDDEASIFKYYYGIGAKSESKSICSHFQMILPSYTTLTCHNGFVHGISGNLFIQPTISTASTVEEFKSYLASQYNNGTPVTVLFQANKTPNTYHLAPAQLQTFLSHNNIWSNADYVEVEYDLHETQDILARKQFIMANQPHIVNPAAAPLQNFVTDMAAPLKECKVEFKPVQDLHGYEKPWVGGSGVNKLEDDFESGYWNTSNNGAAAAGANYERSKNYIPCLANTEYYCTVTNAVTTAVLFFDSEFSYISVATSVSKKVFTTPENAAYFKMYFNKEAENRGVNYPSTETNYIPYSNICPISGWNGCNVYRSGKNLFDINLLAANNITISNGVATGTATNFSKAFGSTYVPLNLDMSARQWTLTMTAYTDGNANTEDVIGLLARFVYSDGTKHGLYFYNTNTSSTTNTITTLANKTPLGIQISYGAGGSNIWHITNIQLEPVLEATTYEPYSGTTLPIDWITEAGTMYGGYVDLVTGEVWKTYYEINITELGTYRTLGINKNNNTQVSWFLSNHLNAPDATGYVAYSRDGYCSCAPFLVNNYYWDSKCQVNNSTADLIIEGELTAEEVDTWIKAHAPIQIVYPLKTPQLITTLTPTQLKTLRGTNNIWSNAGDITLSYWKH